MTTVRTDFDLIVVGSGIAGLAIAELFSRSGWSVALLEKNPGVCMEASGSHHGWFHFGSLYSIFQNNQFMRTLVGGIDDLIEYYSGFSTMNIRVNKEGKLSFPSVPGAWIRDMPMQYIVAARNDRDFNLHVYEGAMDYARKLFFTFTWDLAIKQFISRHQRFHRFDWRLGPASSHIPKAGWMDYSREVIFQVGRLGVQLDSNTHFRVVGFDRPMNTVAIVSDLLKSYIGAGGVFIPRCDYQAYNQHAGIRVVKTSQGDFTTKYLVLASGRELKSQLTSRTNVNVVASPLLVSYPAVCDTNFARLTPFVERTVNHIRHKINGRDYSLIGGGYFASPNDLDAVEKSKSDLLTMARQVFPLLSTASFAETYVSYKTEIASDFGERNYQYLIRDIDDKVFAAVPGKFSLAFSLATNLYKKIVGGNPSATIPQIRDIDVSTQVSAMRHERMVSDFLESDRQWRRVGSG